MGKKEKPAPDERGRRAPAPAALHPAWLWAALCALTLLAYAAALGGPFLFDDTGLDALREPPPPWTLFLLRGARAVTSLSLLADRQMAGLDPRVFHAVNILLHLLNGWLVWRILGRLLARLEDHVRPEAALFGAGLFLLHPLQTESVAYISSRSELLCAFFSYAALLAFLNAPPERCTWPRAAGITALVALAVLSKEPAVAVPAALLLFDMLSEGGISLRPALRRWKLYVPMMAGAALLGVKLFLTLSREGTAGATAKHAPADYLLTQFKVIWLYFRLIVLPLGQNLDHAYPVVKAPGDGGSWLGLVALAALLAGAWRLRRRFPLLLWGLLFLLVLLAPTSSMVPIDDAMAERRLYLGFPGVAMIAAGLAGRRPAGAGLSWSLAAILLVLGFLTMRRAELYTSAQAMWADSVEVNPSNARALFHLGFAYYEQGRCPDAVRQYQKAAAAGGETYDLLVDWALALDCAGDSGEAIGKLKKATTLMRHSHAWSTMGMIYAKRGELEAATQALGQALQIDPQDAVALVYRGNVFLLKHEPAAALADYEAALRIRPDDPGAFAGKQSAQAALRGAR